jgi:hypothetical protein
MPNDNQQNDTGTTYGKWNKNHLTKGYFRESRFEGDPPDLKWRYTKIGEIAQTNSATISASIAATLRA